MLQYTNITFMHFQSINRPAREVTKNLSDPESLTRLTESLVSETAESESFAVERSQIIQHFAGSVMIDGLLRQTEPPTNILYAANIVIRYPSLVVRALSRIQGKKFLATADVSILE
jgi:hypothetical protein